MRERLHDENGAAVIEFVSITVLLLIPALYLIATLFSMQAATFAAEGTAREVARIMSEARSEDSARAHAQAVAQMSAHDLGLDADDVELSITCSTASCTDPKAYIDVVVTVDQPLPLIPMFLADRLGSRVSIAANAVGVANPYLERGP
ncbi:hypothetical protein BSZ39_08470 [Bowdeniella nasicola]|uniref:TadE-like protein n=1 Tax=Bowdeniella nasicola TaxID=208480 RepID=A0A1Q5Q1K6_9ACTO|nr:hypothetical protein [Bowdeniella nasicola]OKL53646.1 hypothetical protein BSZ39_08470 [Bowdeniella nasicola]